MLPPRKITFPSNREFEMTLNYLFGDIYSRTIHDSPKEKEEWKKLTTLEEKVTFLARKLGLE